MEEKPNIYKIDYSKFVLVIGKTIIVTLLTIIIGVNFLYTISQPMTYLDKLYPDNETCYRTAQTADAAFIAGCGRTKTGFWPFIPLSDDSWIATIKSWFPTPVPKYSDWFHDTFVKTYVIDRKFIKTIVGHFMTDDRKQAQPSSIMFLLGFIEFVLLTILLLPFLYIINNLVSAYVGWWAALCGGQIASLIFIAPYNSLYMWLSYLYNSTIGPLIEDTPKFIKAGRKVQWTFVIIFLGIFAMYSAECVSKDVSEKISLLYTIIVCGVLAYQMKHWFMRANTESLKIA